MPKITLNVADVKAAGLKAYNEQRLSAQGPTPRCQYRDPSGLPCIIGSAITDEQFLTLPVEDNYVGVSNLISRGRVKTDDLSALGRGQELHDLWATLTRDPDTTGGYVDGKFIAGTAADFERELFTWLNT